MNISLFNRNKQGKVLGSTEEIVVKESRSSLPPSTLQGFVKRYKKVDRPVLDFKDLRASASVIEAEQKKSKAWEDYQDIADIAHEEYIQAIHNADVIYKMLKEQATIKYNMTMKRAQIQFLNNRG